jgi:hypothetical protein
MLTKTLHPKCQRVRLERGSSIHLKMGGRHPWLGMLSLLLLAAWFFRCGDSTNFGTGAEGTDGQVGPKDSEDGGNIPDSPGSDPGAGNNCTPGPVLDNCQAVAQCVEENNCQDAACLTTCKATACEAAKTAFDAVQQCITGNCLDPCFFNFDQANCDACIEEKCSSQTTACEQQACPTECIPNSDGGGGEDAGNGGQGADGGSDAGAGDQGQKNCGSIMICMQQNAADSTCNESACSEAVSMAGEVTNCSVEACIWDCSEECEYCMNLESADCESCMTSTCATQIADCLGQVCQ